jgi:hypothetical protein
VSATFVEAPCRPVGLKPRPQAIFRTRRTDVTHLGRVERLDGEAKLQLWRGFADAFIRARPRLPPETAAYLLHRGFSHGRHVLYDFPNDAVEDYLSDLQVMLLPLVNGRDAIVLEDRPLFRQVFGNYLPLAPQASAPTDRPDHSPGNGSRIRVVVLRSPETHRPEILAAVYSLATQASGPSAFVELGAVGARIDPVSGACDRAILLSEGEKRRVDRHPDDGAPILGLAVPGWPSILDRILHAFSVLPMFSFVQLDLAPTEDGLAVTDAKSRCDAAEFQVHGPLMASPAAKAFLREYGL